MNISPVFTPFLALNFSKLAYKSGHYKITGSELKASTNKFLATWGQCKQVLMTTLTYYYLLRCYGELRNSCFHIQQTLRNSNTHLEYYFFWPPDKSKSSNHSPFSFVLVTTNSWEIYSAAKNFTTFTSYSISASGHVVCSGFLVLFNEDSYLLLLEMGFMGAMKLNPKS